MFKRRPKAVAEIHLSPNVEGPLIDHWLSNEDICGCAVFKLPPGVEFSHSKVALRGVVTTKTDEHPDALQRSWRTEKQQFLGVTLDSTARADYRSENGIVKIPFRFNLEDIHARNQSTSVAQLPPSLSSKDDSGGKWSGLRSQALAAQYDITYSISASAYSKKGLQASTTKTIDILPASQGPPPESPSDTPGEYFFAESTSPPLKISLAKSPAFTLQLAGQEPDAIILDPHESLSNGSTTVPFVVKALPGSSKTFDVASLPKHCQVSARLVSRTLVSPDRIEERFIPYIAGSWFAKTSCEKIQRSDEQVSDLALPQWNHVAPGSSDQFALTNFSFDFNIASDKRLPSFFTPLLSRRYALDITINFPGNSSPDSKLSLPVRIAYEADEFEYIKPRYP